MIKWTSGGQIMGLSADTKPTLHSGEGVPIPNGTRFFEEDTGKFFVFNDTWQAISSASESYVALLSLITEATF